MGAARLLLLLLSVCHISAGRVGIINGDDAEEHEYPFMVRLLFLGSRHMCGASLIRPNVVLTAAHCVDPQFLDDITDMKVAVGDYSQNTTGENEQILELSKIIVHEKYNSKYGFPLEDVALLILKEEVELKEGVIETVALAQSEALYEEGTNVTVVGWGKTETGELAETLQELHYSIADQAECSEFWKEFGLVGVQPGQFCVIDPERETSAYKGDSGGPLVEKVGDKFVQVGLVSWGQPIHMGISYNMFTNVFYYVDWIEAKLARDDSDEEDCKFDVKDWIELTGMTSRVLKSKVSKKPKGKITCEIEPQKYGEILDMKKLDVGLALAKNESSEVHTVSDMKYKKKGGKHLFTGYYWISEMIPEVSCRACVVSIPGLEVQATKIEGPRWCNDWKPSPDN